MIRLINDNDIDAVMDIWLKTNISAHDFIPENYWIGNFHAVKGDFLPKSENYIFIEDNTVKAFISIMEGRFIGALFVSMEHQKQGIGKQLIEHCKNIYNSLDVAVYVDNTQAKKFYENCGFYIEREQRNKDSGFQEYIMEWKKN